MGTKYILGLSVFSFGAKHRTKQKLKNNFLSDIWSFELIIVLNTSYSMNIIFNLFKIRIKQNKQEYNTVIGINL